MPLQNDSTNPPLTVEALKTVQGGTISRLHATPESQVAEVPVAKWIHGAAYLYGNHSIAGITRLNNINLYNDLTVNGPVNGVPWQTDKLILIDKDQDVPGSLLVSNSLPEQKRVMSNNVKNLWVDFVNDLPVNELLVSKAENRPNLHVESQLIFTQPLTVGYYEAGNGNGLLDKYYKKKRGVESNDIHDWQQLQENVAAIKNRLASKLKTH
ncbi:GD10065 [Drosophila simulans]|uniref:GD10065 n=1 Tax=Drosophila simulans TaxID=7240 RepID=B4QHB3_DROSI|nr:GD10065 [Drosophila simulans]